MKKLLLFVIAIMLLGSVMAQDEPPFESTSSLRLQLGKTNVDSVRLALQLSLAYSYMEEASDSNRNYDTALQLIKGVGRSSLIRTSRHLQGLLHYTYGFYYRGMESRDSAIKESSNAVNVLDSSTFDWARACVELGYNYSHGDPIGDSVRGLWFRKALPILARINTVEGKEWYGHTLMCLAQSGRIKPRESIEMNLKAIQVWKSAGHKDYCNIYSHIGGSYSHIGDQVQGLNYALMAVREDERLARPDDLSALVYNDLGYCYYEQGNSKEALPNFQKAFDIQFARGDSNSIPTSVANLTSIMVDLGDYAHALELRRKISARFTARSLYDRVFENDGFAMIFAKLKQADSMRPYVNRLLELDPQMPRDSRLRMRVVRDAAAFYNLSGQYAEGRKYAQEMLRLGNVLGLVNASFIGYRELSKSDSGLGNYKASLAEYQKYIYLQDSVRDASNAKQAASLRLQYETEKKDKDIQALKHREELSQSNLKQAALTRNFIIAAAVLLLILLVVAVNRYRLKQRSNKQMAHLLEEKEWLLKEIHHRVKNNLQIVMSLLNSQSAFIDNEIALTAIHDSRHRVYAMSLIHQKLYSTDNVSSINISSYTRELVSYLVDSFDMSRRIRIEYNIEPIILDVGQAVPLGLIMNEAITNSIKYAFPESRPGTISVSLTRIDARHCQLIISDNGIGMPTHISHKKNGSLGMTLMRGLSNNLNGSFSIENRNGTIIKIVFVIEPANKMAGSISGDLVANN
jgi:two-component sensor histidine kinase/tetratricopeptide (TPR) repeat protein